MTVRHNPRRRGALLLVILALLTMFGLVAVAFVVLTQQARSGAKAMARIDQSADPPQKVCDQAMRQLLRGSNNPASRIGPHSLLETMYGNGAFQTPLTGVTSACGGQLLEVTFANPGRVVGGCVITMLTGNCAGQSSYIVGLNPTSGNPQIEAFDNVVPSNPKTLPAVGDMCLINGTPWSGLGLGYNTSTGSLNAMSGSYEIALLPGYPLSNYTATAGNPPGGANTDYTAADFQHMLLAAQEPVNTGAPIPPLWTPLPSMHRPDLINYWLKRTSAGAWTTLDPVLLRQIMLRPNPIDHPNFTGSNPNFNPVSGPWDVDNDGDGVADSVWVDLGMPVRAMADGRLYKPLFAILCVDLDGRLNLNAHGNLGQANAGAPYLSTPQPSSGGFATAANEFIASSGLASASGNPATQSAVLPRGLGYGPAEINLLPAFTDLSGNDQFALYNNLLAGSTSLSLAGRYAEVGSTAEPGVPNVMAPLTYNKWYDYGAINNVSNYYWNYQNPATYQADAYGTPPDPYGYGAIGLDPLGQPLYLEMGGTLVNSPYDLDLSHNAPHGLPTALSTGEVTPPDNPFGAAELERLLRPFDRDSAGLPGRLVGLSLLTNGYSLLQQKRCEVTTESWDLPCPAVALSASARHTLGRPPQHITDLLVANGITAPAALSADMLPPEMMAGLKLNLNRPLGLWVGAPLQPPVFSQYTTSTVTANLSANFSYDPNGPQSSAAPPPGMFAWIGAAMSGAQYSAWPAQIQARQKMAKYLYVLMMMLYDNNASVQTFVKEGGTFPAGSAAGKDFAARRIAQWAINAVTFATNDSVMVPFKYDPYVLGISGSLAPGWHLQDDSIVPNGTNPALSAGQVSADSAANFGVVWGCKPPEMLLTETFSCHDRRVADTAWDPNKVKRDQQKTPPPQGDAKPNETPADVDLDQARIPQGSLFFELYRPRGTLAAAPTNDTSRTYPSDLYTYSTGTGQWSLDLARMAAQKSANGLYYPVWRVIVTQSNRTGEDPTGNSDVQTRLGLNPDSSSLETEQYSGDPTTGRFSLIRNTTLPNVKIDRVVWFTTTKPTPKAYGTANNPTTACHLDGDRIYYNHSGNTLLGPDQYAIVAPRLLTYIGSVKGGTLGTPGPQKIDLRTPGAGGIYSNSSGTQLFPTVGSQVKQPLVILAAADPPSGWTNAAHQTAGIGISVSEPLFSNGYYTEPNVAGLDPLATVEWYGDPNQVDATKGYFLDHPLDGANTTLTPKPPLFLENLLQTGTTFNYKTLVLQRLANPSMAYDPIINPYRTVDWMPVDLTVFNGEDTQPADWDATYGGGTPATIPWDTDDPTCDPSGANYLKNIYFKTRERGIGNVGAADFPNLWTQVSVQPPTMSTPATVAGTPPIFPFDLVNSLGYLNTTYWPTPPVLPNVPSSTTIAGNVRTDGGYVGDPMQPFPWIAWNNRPYVSPLELLQVPACPASRLMLEFSTTSSSGNINSPPTSSNPYSATPPYPQLAGLFQSEASTTTGTAPQLYRILEYVGVPSRFVGTETFINPTTASGSAGHSFHPPFNRISHYREPGRINLNTIYTQDVFNGLMNYFPGMSDGTVWSKFVRSRRGLSATDPLAMDSTGTYPTLFAHPFRSFAGGDMVPTLNGQPALQLPTEIEATVLRSDPDYPQVRPLFQFDTTLTSAMMSANTPFPYNDPNRNAFFRYQAIERLGNLVTTRSNVYAMWITVGYFQVTPAPIKAGGTSYDPTIYPDGYQLGPELGADTGEVERHRAFYIYDRTIPVGFQRGQDINVEKGLLLRRFIE